MIRVENGERQRWLRWGLGLVIAACLAWFGVDARVRVLEQQIGELQYQVRQLQQKVDRLLIYRPVYDEDWYRGRE